MEKLERFKRITRERGLRVTPQRVAVYKEILSRKDHPSAEEIYEALKDKVEGISLTTVYRTLSNLEEVGLVVRIPTLKDKVHYDARVEPHSHFICLKCGRIYDVEVSPEVSFENLKKEGFEVSNSAFICYGICKNCKVKNEEV
ncbi:ferric uptake regulator, Fur family [Desulfurobacterium thermolithotrophum DSM 11699]|uniref:Ferric uptake regulator, Fur family n=1 Tax=Desulfurobacterium thermolithotrophum (strain DSM 11699 / BSA) TaxID=868864 RepID=F0S0J4_DESTD|nr:Fur family transcriptional regulator [Desulfurobacterium thermolithotrophum]ADY72722.1 ferric uptake regulator, Fur family [Desulfurobacterium thermolithotrophum DSM 11699]